jgi:DNA-directed RNA polymerase subunit H (RpoH/RPB5)
MANTTRTMTGAELGCINKSPKTGNNDKVISESDNAYAEKAVKLAKNILAAGLCIAAVASVGAVFGWTFTLCGINSGIATTSGAKVVTSVVATIGITMNSLAAKVVSAAANLAIFACAADIISGTNWLIRPPIVTNREVEEDRQDRENVSDHSENSDSEDETVLERLSVNGDELEKALVNDPNVSNGERSELGDAMLVSQMSPNSGAVTHVENEDK